MLKSLVKYMTEGNCLWKDLITDFDRREIKKAISQVINVLGKQGIHGTLNKRQKGVMKQFNELECLLQTTNLISQNNGMKIAFWTFLEEGKNVFGDMNPSILHYIYILNHKGDMALTFQDPNKSGIIVRKCEELEARLGQIICHKSFFPAIWRWIFENTFGNIDHVITISLIFLIS